MPGVTAIASKRILEFTPNNPLESADSDLNNENQFDVIVVNDSDKFASFQLELSAAGVDENSHVKWYCVEPEICAKTPPGSETKFQIAITKAPIPAYDTNIDLELNVFSVEYEKLKTKKNLKLKINRPLKSLQVDMPVKKFRVKPGDNIQIPILVYNLSSKFSEVTLSCSLLNPEWMSETQKKLQLEPGESENITFLCQPPKGTISKNYEFIVEVASNTSNYSTREQGVLEVLADGFVEFSCPDKHKIIPGKEKHNYRTANYELLFWNDSNLPRCVDIIVQDKYREQCKIQVSEGVNVAPGETKIMQLSATPKRHWLGTDKLYKFPVSCVLSNPASGKFSMDIFPKPDTKYLEIKTHPIIPFLIQLGGTILIPILLFLNWWMRPLVYHRGSVNSVRFFGNGSLVFSGSSDQTIRRWQVEDNFRLFKRAEVEEKGTVAELDKAVRVIRQSPKDNDVIAVGLENGEIKLWDIASNQQKKIDFPYNNVNRVFDLIFTQDGRSLFSGHASGIVNRWNLESNAEGSAFVANKTKADFAVYALAIDESIPDNPLVVIAGRYNKIAVWQPNNASNQNIYNLPYELKSSKYKPVIGQQDYITSIANTNKVLASADNQGYITLWNMNKIHRCINEYNIRQKEKFDKLDDSTSDNSNKLEKVDNNQSKTINCNQIITDQWNDGHDKQPVRSVALSQNGCYLATAGDDGKVMLWSLSKGERIQEKGETIFNYPDTKFNAVDIKALKDKRGEYILITSGDDNYQVRIERKDKVKGITNNASCQQ